jgi:hypothetical protein
MINLFCFLFGHKKPIAINTWMGYSKSNRCTRCNEKLGLPDYKNPPPPPLKGSYKLQPPKPPIPRIIAHNRFPDGGYSTCPKCHSSRKSGWRWLKNYKYCINPECEYFNKPIPKAIKN